jgi:hypothetical protein
MSGGRKEPGERRKYLSYLLRLWQVDTGVEGAGGSGMAWRGSLECSLSGERQGFASLDELLEFLYRQTGAMADADGKQS